MESLILFSIGIATIVIIVAILYLIGEFCTKTKYHFVNMEKALEGETGFSRFFLTLVSGFFNLLILLINIVGCIVLYCLTAEFGRWVHTTFF